jgi:hypothetical protein
MLVCGRLDGRPHVLARFPVPARFACPCGARTVRMFSRVAEPHLRTTYSLSDAPAPNNYSRRLRQSGSYSTCTTSDLLLQHSDKTLATYVQNSWNTCNIHLKHLQNTRKKHETTCVAIANIATCRWKHLQHMYENTWIAYIYVTFRSTFATSRWHTCNIRLKQMKHLEYALEIYVYSHCNICNIPIYFCKHLKHLQHTSEIFETYACNMRF